jgi:DNA-binding NarL/FixJ family response regulator
LNLVGVSVWAKASPRGVPEPALGGHGSVHHLSDEAGLDPAGVAGVLAWHRFVERAVGPVQRPQLAHQLGEHGLGEAGADLAEVAQPALAVVGAEQQGAENAARRSSPGAPAADDDLSSTCGCPTATASSCVGSCGPGVRDLNCLMLTSLTDEQAMMDAVLAGAGEYVIKDIKGMELVSAIRTVGQGRSLLDNRAAAALMRRLRASVEQPGPLAGLSEQERTLLELIGEGLTNRADRRPDVPRREDRQELRLPTADQARHAAPHPGRRPGHPAARPETPARPRSVPARSVPVSLAVVFVRARPSVVRCSRQPVTVSAAGRGG